MDAASHWGWSDEEILPPAPQQEQAPRHSLQSGCFKPPSLWGFVTASLVTSTTLLHLTNIEHGLGFPGGSAVKNPPAMQEMWVCPLGWKDPLEKEMATHSSILAWRIAWTEEPGRPHTIHAVAKESDTTQQLNNNSYYPLSIEQNRFGSCLHKMTVCWEKLPLI